jgi:alpha-galactosidase
VVFGPNTTLKPGETFSTPRCFVAVYAGDFYEALRLWSNVLQRQGWTLPQPSEEAYQVSWSAWGYESDVKRAQLLGTIPKLKELNIKWGAVDYCWFDHFGDWNPRPDIFPGNSIREVVDEFHKQGVRVALWWRPMAVEDGPGQLFTHRYAVARIVRQHPNWLILDKNGKPAQIRDGLAAFCPALREVQDYHKKLTEKFIRDWGFDGNKLDMVYSLPPCYNPTHHHKSPEESIYAMAEVFKVIFQTTRQLKPDGVTQTCPCGTMPNLAWLPYMDQAVTADPLGSVQMRRRIKVYKGLLGPEAAVYADHIELSEMKLANGEWAYLGKDFASTVGVGGVIGTKFVWPEAEPRFRSVLLTPEKYSLWKKWIGIYQDKMPSRGTFLNLYVHAYDVPEGYAIEKDGNMYYAFFAPQASREWKGGPQNGAENFTFHTPQPPTGWKGELELRGLEQGRYRVLDYENGSVLGTVEGPNPKLLAAFSEHLLLEVSKVK